MNKFFGYSNPNFKFAVSSPRMFRARIRKNQVSTG